MRSSTGSSIGKIEVKKLGLGVSNSSLVFSPIRSWSASGSGVGPVVSNSPSSLVKVMPPSLLLYLTSVTSPCSDPLQEIGVSDLLSGLTPREVVDQHHR